MVVWEYRGEMVTVVTSRHLQVFQSPDPYFENDSEQETKGRVQCSHSNWRKGKVGAVSLFNVVRSEVPRKICQKTQLWMHRREVRSRQGWRKRFALSGN